MTGLRPMSRTTARRALFCAGLVLAPLPMFGFADASVPVLRMVELAVVVLVTMVVEGPGGVIPLFLALFLTHVAVYTLLVWAAAWLLARLLDGVAPAARATIVTGLILVVLGVTIAIPVYETPFHARVPRATLLEVYE